jgi:hypothetical protein
MHAWAIVAVLIVALAGCGGRGRGRGGPLQAGLRRQGRRDLRGHQQEETALNPGGLGWHYRPKFDDARFLTTFTAVARTGLRRLRALDSPEEHRQAADKLRSSLERVVAPVDEAIAAIRARENERHATAAWDYETAYSDVAASTAELGLSECQGVGN